MNQHGSTVHHCPNCSEAPSRRDHPSRAARWPQAAPPPPSCGLRTPHGATAADLGTLSGNATMAAAALPRAAGVTFAVEIAFEHSEVNGIRAQDVT